MEKNQSYLPVRIIFIILALAVMVIIFMFSSENADRSSDTSGTVTEFVAEHVVRDFKELPPQKQTSLLSYIDHIVRKCAHFSIYASLGFCLSNAAGKRRFISAGSLAALGISFMYACSDEIHQYFVPGRACMFTDVLIDSCGALTGITVSLAIIALISLLLRKRAAAKSK